MRNKRLESKSAANARSYEAVVDMGEMNDEIAIWQKAIYELCKKHKPDVDGAGSDGDELDLTLSEINEVFIMYEDELASLRQRVAALEGHLVGVLLENKPTDATCQCFSNDDNCAWHRARKAVLSAYEAATTAGGE